MSQFFKPLHKHALVLGWDCDLNCSVAKLQEQGLPQQCASRFRAGLGVLLPGELLASMEVGFPPRLPALMLNRSMSNLQGVPRIAHLRDLVGHQCPLLLFASTNVINIRMFAL